jgi:N-acetylneuraminate lyase
MKKINGYIAAPFTPMKDNGDLNLDLVPEYAEFLIRNGLSGVFVNGSTGEGALLTREERMTVAEKWMEAGKIKLKVIVHTGGTNIREQQILAKHARKIGAWAFAAMAPTFLPPSRNEEFVAYCKAIASAAPNLPFYYYHIPPLNNFRMSVTKFLEVADREIPNLVGVKYTDFNIFEFEVCRKIAGGKFEMLWGLDEIFLDGLTYGNGAGVGGTYNHCFGLYSGMKDAFENKDLDTAKKLQYQSHEFCKILGKYRGNLAGGKRIMKFLGLDCGPNRLPLQTISSEEEKMMRMELQDIGFFEYCNK